MSSSRLQGGRAEGGVVAGIPTPEPKVYQVPVGTMLSQKGGMWGPHGLFPVLRAAACS